MLIRSVTFAATAVTAFLGLVEGKLVHVNDRNFTDVVINSGKPTLVDFYADWCRHCAKLMPTIEKVAALYDGDDSIQFVKVNGDKDGKVAARKYVDIGYPTVKFFFGKKMDPVEFDGSRDAESLNNFVQLILKTRVKNIDIVDPKLYQSTATKVDDVTFDSHINGSKDSIVLFTESGSTSDSLFQDVWEKVITAYANENDVQFLLVNIKDEMSSGIVDRFKDVISSYGEPTVLVFKKTDTESPKVYSGKKKDAAFVINFINGSLLLFRLPNGRLRNKAGRLLNYEPVIKKLIINVDKVSEKEAYEKFVKDLADSPIGSLDDLSMLEYYDKVIAAILEGRKSHYENELKRISTILDTDVAHINAKSLDSFEKRYNILKAIFG
ncbi:uncharacterized protein KQ657_001573 [Scheffersomyces spartinae]|uniref:protein disulfide-isomerase n=1 Tax=Scheffersomyces spartinae TaxID=45513 RepID=A0A9P7V7H3_9ASCO|nr:uncharacterized protein KQ657_001573 [Scheffersomyces spartinae]KAG7192788.1 hypothetical protein KQ657_001573 [Scheffersomyces spartinae]